MMDISGDHFGVTAEGICLLLFAFSLLEGNKDYSGHLFYTAVVVNHYSNS